MHEGWAGVAEVMLDPADGIEGVLIDGPIDAGDVDVGETDGHAGEPGAAIAADLRFEAALAGEQDEGLPDVAAPERCLGIEARLSDAARDAVDHAPDDPAIDMGDLVEGEDRATAGLGKALERVLGGAHALEQAGTDLGRAPGRGGEFLGEGLAAAGDAAEVDTAGVEPGQGRDRASEARGQADQPVGAIGRGERRLNGGAPALHGCRP